MHIKAIVQRMVAFPDHQVALSTLVSAQLTGLSCGAVFHKVCELSACTTAEIIEAGMSDKTQSYIGTNLIYLEEIGLVRRLGFTDGRRSVRWGLAFPFIFLAPDRHHAQAGTKAWKTAVTNFRKGPDNYRTWRANIEHLFRLGQSANMPIEAYELFPQLVREDYGFFETAYPNVNVQAWAERWLSG